MARLTILALAAATTLGVVATASAETGPYFAASLSYAHIDDADIDGIDTSFGRQPGGYIAADPGYGVNMGLGYGFDNNWRAELELNYRRANYKRATAGALTDADSDGSFRQTAVFANLYYDFQQVESGIFAGITPYVGGGVGWAHIKWDKVQTFNAVERVGHDSSDNAAAAQVMLGFSYDVPGAEGLSITTELRHTRLLGDLTFKGRVLESRFGSFPIQTDVKDKGRTEINIGLRRQF